MLADSSDQIIGRPVAHLVADVKRANRGHGQ
jgi:hypothetical protein